MFDSVSRFLVELFVLNGEIMLRKKRTVVCAALLSMACVCQAVTHRLQWKPTADSEFEVGTQLRPWTILRSYWK